MTLIGDGIEWPWLSVRQPWAWALIHAGKDFENRSDAVAKRLIAQLRKRRGLPRLVIHASLGMHRREYEWAALVMADLGVLCPAPADLVRGAAIGSVQVDQVLRYGAGQEFRSPWRMEDGRSAGLVVSAPEPWGQPMPAKGALGLFVGKHQGEVAKPAAWMAAYTTASKERQC